MGTLEGVPLGEGGLEVSAMLGLQPHSGNQTHSSLCQ